MAVIILVVLLLLAFPAIFGLASAVGLLAVGSHQPIEFTGGAASPTKLQREVAANYSKFKIKTLPSFREFCFPSKFAVQKQQAFLGEYVGPHGDTKEILVFHGIGSGKTCVAAQIMQKYVERGRPLILLPASLIPGVYAELRSPCGGDLLTPAQRAQFADGTASVELQSEIKAKIDAKYQILSYNKFQTSWRQIDAPCLVVDEVQNIDNPSGAFYTAIRKWIEAHPKATICLMSGTPLFDNKIELASLAALLRIKTPSEITVADVPRLFANKVSYFQGAPSYVFPEVTLKIKRLPMSRFQAKWFTSNVVAEERRGKLHMISHTDSFYCKSRQVANVAFPNGLMGAAGLAQLTAPLIKDHLATYSCKMAHLAKKLLRGGLAFVYSAFVGPGGVQTICKVLTALGYKDYNVKGPGKKRFAVWSGEQSQKEKDKIRTEFNSAANDTGHKIQVVIGSPAIKEGVSLARVRRVFVMEFYWNHSRMAQIYGRASRFCSHKSLPADDRTVEIIVYAAVNPTAVKKKDGMHSPRYSVDLYMKDLADAKRKQNEPYVEALKDCAVDRLLFEKANVD